MVVHCLDYGIFLEAKRLVHNKNVVAQLFFLGEGYEFVMSYVLVCEDFIVKIMSRKLRKLNIRFNNIKYDILHENNN